MATNEQNIIVKFTADTSGLQPAIEQMRILGKITDEDARKISEINAEQQKFNTTVNATTNEFTDFSKTFKTLGNDIKAQVIVEASNQLKEFAQEATKSGTEVKSLKAQLRELKAQIASGSLGEKEMKEATKRAAELTDHLGDVNQRIKALSSDTRRLDAVVEGFRGIAGAVSVATGAMALFGSENKELEKTLVKVQSAMAILQGVQELSNLALGDGALKTQLLSTYQTLAGKTATVMGFEISGATAMATGGLTLLVAGLVYLVTTLDDTSEATKKYNDELQALVISTQDLAEKSAESLRLLQITGRQRALEEIKLQTKSELKEFDEKYKKQMLGAKMHIDMVQNANKIADSQATSAMTKNIEEQQQIYNNLFVTRENILTASKLKEKAVNDEYDKKEKDEKAKQNKKLLDIEKAHQAELLANKRLIEAEIRRLEKEKVDFLKAQKDIELKSEKDYTLTYLQELQVRFDLAYAKKVEHDNAIKKQSEDTQKALVAAAFQAAGILSNTLFTLTSQNIKATEDAEIESINRRTEKELQARGVTEVQKAKIEERAQKEIARAKQRAWKDQQQADIAQAVINGALAVTNALATVKPFPAAIIAAGLAGLQTAAQVAIIKNTPTPKFAKGTMKVLGEGSGTSDNVPALLSHGESVFTASTTSDYYPALSTIFDRKVSPQLANDLLTDLANGNFNINPEYHNNTTTTLDYNRLGQIVKQGQSKVVINIDKNGFEHFKQSSFGKTQYVNSKFKYEV